MVGQEDKRRNGRTMLPTLKNNFSCRLSGSIENRAFKRCRSTENQARKWDELSFFLSVWEQNTFHGLLFTHLIIFLQTSGFAVVADRLNFYRFLSHFRCVHRGSFFSQMRTTSVRKLLPEAWGMMLPNVAVFYFLLKGYCHGYFTIFVLKYAHDK